MNEELIIKIKKEIKKSEETGIYDNLYSFAYSDDLYIRFLFMNILISSSKIDLYELYEDDITHYFVTYDDNGNIVKKMPYKYISIIGDKLLKSLDLTSYNKVINFIINTYFPSPEEFHNSLVK